MSLNYTTMTVTVKQREFLELHSEAIRTLAWVWQGNNNTQVPFHMPLFNHKHEECFLGFSLQNTTDTIFSKFRSRPCRHHTMPWENHSSRGTKAICLGYPTSKSFPVPLSSPTLLRPRPRNPWLTKLGNYIPFEKMDGAQHWLLFSLVFTQLHILFPALALLALSGKHVPGCSAY